MFKVNVDFFSETTGSWFDALLGEWSQIQIYRGGENCSLYGLIFVVEHSRICID